MQQLAHIALGANLGEPQATLQAAFKALDEIAHARLLRASSLYRSAPVGLAQQPDFINAVAALEVDDKHLPANDLLQQLLAIEQHFGRVRSVKNAPRTLDLDLLLYGDLQQLDEALTLPHPRMTERAFVLLPLAEISPTLQIPGQGALNTLLAGVADQQIEKLAASASGVS